MIFQVSQQFQESQPDELLVSKRRVYCLGLTNKRQPKHPLFLRADQELQPLTWSMMGFPEGLL